MNTTKKLSIRWSDIDPNLHLRHSVYYDFGAQLRTEVLNDLGLTLQLFRRENIGPVLFKEECLFHREIHFGDEINLDFEIIGLSKDMERFAFRHRFVREDGTLCATLTLTGAWIDTVARKLAVPTDSVVKLLEKAPRSEDFEWITTSKTK